MKCKISCSFGEIIDKITILNIKSKKITDKDALKNVNLELDILQKENPLSDENDDLFDKLQKINQKLWILEDIIREKSKSNIFDNSYIKIAESIHKTNDERCEIKKLINIKYNSELIEEKSYNQKSIKYDDNDLQNLEKGKVLYTNGNYKESFTILDKLIKKFVNYNTYDNFFVDLNFSYNNIIKIFNYKNVYKDQLDYIMENLNKLNILNELKVFCNKIYASECLHNKIYINDYLNLINDITGPNVNYSNMSFFNENDSNKHLLIYDGGGLGDKFMFARFIPILCKKYEKNKVTFFTNDNVTWFFDEVFSNIKNLKIVGYSKSFLLGKFDHHCNLLSLLKYLNIGYENITFDPLFKNLKSNDNLEILNKIKNTNKKTYVFNWKGNPQNLHEKYNRKMNLVNAIPLFKLKDINWVILSKDVSKNELKILKKYNVSYYGNLLDNGNKCFEDSINIMKNVDGVISTDTSLVHLSANLNVKTFVLLTLGCEWRWTSNDKTTNWYPDSILIRQNKFNDWSNVIEELISKL